MSCRHIEQINYQSLDLPSILSEKREVAFMRYISVFSTQKGGGGVIPHKRLMGMCRWMGSHFHVWIDYNGVAFSIELLEWGRTFPDLWGK